MRLPFAVSTLVLTTALLADPGAARGQAPVTLHRTVVATVGTVDGFSALTFGELGGMGFDGSGRLHVLDQQAGHVVVVDTLGRLLEVVGRRGQGPGEFRMPHEMMVFPDGTLGVVDFGRGLVLLDPDGTDRGSLRLSDAGYNQRRMVTADGELVSWDTVEGALLAARGGPRRVIRGHPEVADSWRVVHEAPMPALAGPDGRVGGDLWSGGLPGLVEYVPELHVAALPDGRLAVADTTTYRVVLLDRDGVETGRIVRDHPPRRVTNALREEALASILGALDEATAGASMRLDDGRTVPAQGYAREIQRQRARAMRFGPEVPLIQALAADGDGRLWVLRETADGQARALDLFEGDGRFLGTATETPERLPEAFGPHGLAAWTVIDEMGVPRIRIERIEVLQPTGPRE